MKCYLSLKRLNGARLTKPAPETSRRLVTVTLTTVGGYRVAEARCCQGGADVAALYEPTLIRVAENAFLFQGFEKAGEQGTVQEWVVEPHCSGSLP
jgi:hypothetical protein